MGDIRVTRADELSFEGKTYRCAVGENGFTGTPREGAKATPLGIYPLRECWYRPDRLKAPNTLLPLRMTREDDGWCDDPAHPQYNRHVKLPFSASHELLWRQEHVYDIIVPIGFNDSPVVPGMGSAIFLHLARPDYAPTLGCVAVSLADMLEILENAGTSTRIILKGDAP